MSKNSWRVILITVLWSSCTYDHFNEVSSICASTSISLTFKVINASTCGASDGSIIISTKGGVKSYSFSVNGGTYQPDSVYSNLKSGSYTVAVKDANGCTSTQIASVNNGQSSLQISVSTTPNSGCPTPNGTITVLTTGAKNPVQYRLNSGTYQSGNTFTGLAAGNYSITVLDSTGCPASGSASVSSRGPSFKTDIGPIISANCNSCHSGGRTPDLSSYTSISANGTAIVGAINNDMPPGGKLTAQQIALITCWVNDGALNN
jgi:hypothetical protein